MGFKMKGFPMHSPASALKQVTTTPPDVTEQVVTEKPVVEEGGWSTYTPTEEEIANEPRKYKFAGASEWEKNPTTGEIRRVKQKLTEKELGQLGLMEQEISALGEEPDPFGDPEANEAYWVKHRAIRSKYGQ